MGLTLIYNDAGWPEIESAFVQATKFSIIKISLMAVVVIAATWVTVYLFIGLKKKEYAIMRALGTPKGTAARALLLPLMAVAIVSVLVGSGVAWAYIVRTISGNEILTAMTSTVENTSVPAWVIIVCVAGEVAATLAIALALLRDIGKKPPLTLLHDRMQGGAK